MARYGPSTRHKTLAVALERLLVLKGELLTPTERSAVQEAADRIGEQRDEA